MNTLPDRVNPENPEGHHKRWWDSTLLDWAIAFAVIASTYALVPLGAIEPHEWATTVTFIAAHIIAANFVEGHERQ
jgi:hypothetical protein